METSPPLRGLCNPPLRGLRVLDLTRLLPGPFATKVLADLGASVDKLEDPQAGDYLRHMPPSQGGRNPVFEALNRGKRSVVLDLKRAEGRAALLRLAPLYDVLVESFRPGVMDRLGVGYDALSAVSPGLVYCAISGYGQTGPLAPRAGHDLDYLARSGVLSLHGPPEGPPSVPGVQSADVAGGALFAVVGILAALEGRRSSGVGRFVDISMCEGVMNLGLFGIVAELAGMKSAHGEGVISGGIAPYGTYRTKDDRFVALGALEPKFFAAFCAEAGIAFDAEALFPGPHQDGWRTRVAAAIATRTRAEWEEASARIDACLEPVLEPHELASDAQHVARGLVHEGALTLPITPLGAPGRGDTVAKGANTREILEEAGLSAEEIAQLV